MGILTGVLWIVAGVAYLLYKFGSEELKGGFLGGVGFVALVAAVIAAFVSVYDLSEALPGFLILMGFVGVIVFVIVANIRQLKPKKLPGTSDDFEIRIIQNDLPMPTDSQMKSFINDIRYTTNPSQLQLEYREMLRRADANLPTVPLGVSHFKYMQAAWIYYSNSDAHTKERERIFGNQDLSKKTFFDPSQ